MDNIIVTGSGGLIGSAVCNFFSRKGYCIHGVDNDMRKRFFGKEASVIGNIEYLLSTIDNYHHNTIDIRNQAQITDLYREVKPCLTIHCAAQPSHDLAAQIPIDDFTTNANGTLNLLEGARNFVKDSPFVYLSTNKVYGDNPNRLEIVETEKRWEFSKPLFRNGINESMSIDHCTHSLFGVSKTSADLLVQEYGKYFSMPTVCLRGGCLTGEGHKGIELHGFLSYLTKVNVLKKHYKIFGYKGKQVRDNIHSTDVASFIFEYFKNPRIGEVYNIGGGYGNSISILEAIDKIEQISSLKQSFEILDEARVGDHICYYSDLSKAMGHYKNWEVEIKIESILERMIEQWRKKIR
jgi:CDP-paratose 2-epimerase